MAYDEGLATDIRAVLKDKSGIEEKKMFGGLCFFLNSNMLCGIEKGRFMFRVGKEQEEQALSRQGSQVIKFNGRRMGGLIWVDAAACKGATLKDWIAIAVRFVGNLPPKRKK